MLDQALHQATLDFARTLRHAPAVAAYESATEALDADPGAQALLADMREHQAALVRLQQSGESPTQPQIDAFRRSQEAIRGCATIMAHLRATAEVKAFLPVVARRITASLGFDYAQIVAPKSC
jgi:cell fate (sporulation/competence/biofilm development) regulator YlbF (YheA/YmcA/DUF963 family)